MEESVKKLHKLWGTDKKKNRCEGKIIFNEGK